MTPSVSVVIAAYNAAPTITDQLDALASQTYRGCWDVIVADNGSTDETRDVARSHSGLNGRVRVVDASDRPGPAFARNVGVASSDAERILFCDADDVVSDRWVETLARQLDDVELVGGPYELYALNPSWLAESRGRQRLDKPLRWGPAPVFAAGNLGIRRDTFERIGGFNESFRGHEDHELSLRCYAAGIVYHHCPTAVVHYRLRQDPSSIYHQGLHYGGSHAALAVVARGYGLPRPRRVELKPWLWLIAKLPTLRTAEGRACYLWVAAVRLGRLRGACRERAFYI